MTRRPLSDVKAWPRLARRLERDGLVLNDVDPAATFVTTHGWGDATGWHNWSWYILDEHAIVLASDHALSVLAAAEQLSIVSDAKVCPRIEIGDGRGPSTAHLADKAPFDEWWQMVERARIQAGYPARQ